MTSTTIRKIAPPLAAILVIGFVLDRSIRSFPKHHLHKPQRGSSILEASLPNTSSRRSLATFLSQYVDPRSVTQRSDATPYKHDGERLCIASVNDGTVATSSVIDEGGKFVNLAMLPAEMALNVECTLTDQTTGEVVPDDTYTITADQRIIPSNNDESPPRAACDRKGFQPGYYSRNAWNDCSGLTANFDAPGALAMRELMEEGLCRGPVALGKRDVWVSMVGDSVMRQIFNGMGFDDARGWTTNGESQPNYFVGSLEFDGGIRVWFTFYGRLVVSRGKLRRKIPLRHSWGDFVRDREEGPREDDPPFGDADTPDVVFFGPGYHASNFPAEGYGEGLGMVLDRWGDDWEERDAPMPRLHILLNMMPAPWMIPDKYKADRKFRTELNEYRKNLAVLSTVRRYDFVNSVVDLFSVELPFNGHEHTDTAHKDAVHMDGAAGLGLRVMNIAGRLIVDRVCTPPGLLDDAGAARAAVLDERRERKERREKRRQWKTTQPQRI